MSHELSYSKECKEETSWRTKSCIKRYWDLSHRGMLRITVRRLRMLAIKGGTLLTPDERIEEGALLIEDGKIIAVGKDITIPPDT